MAAEEPPATALKLSHRYNLDLSPRLLLSAGSTVDVLRTSGVANYLEFKPLAAFLYGEGVAPLDEERYASRGPPVSALDPAWKP